jgi:eukaryotic-like serine/threonine-protein kinase
VGEPGRWNIHLLPLVRQRKPVILAATPFDEYQPQFSPDGRWIAYTSNESGRYETYVVNVPEAAGGRSGDQGKWQISTAGGQQPRWRRDGKELFFLSTEGKMMAVNIDASGQGFRASAPALLFTTALIPIGPPYLYDVTADGRRFVALNPVGGATTPLSVIVNWADALVMR